MTLTHLTVDTGHSNPSSREDVQDCVIDLLAGIARRGTGVVRGLRFDVAAIPGGWRFTIGQDESGSVALVTCHVAASGGGPMVWADVVRHRTAMRRGTPRHLQPASEPWLAITLEDALLGCDPMVLYALHLGDAERCMAWTLLERATTAGNGSGRGAAGQQPPRLTGTLASAVAALAAEACAGRDLRAVAGAIGQAGRWSLADEVVAQALAIDAEWESLLGLLPSLHLPFDPLWLEFNAVAGWLSGGHGPRRIGILVTKPAGDRLRARVAFERDGRAYLADDVLEAGPLGAHPAQDEGTLGWAPAADVLSVAVRLLLVLTAKRAPITIGAAEDFAKLNKARARSGRPPLLATCRVKWDLTPVRHGRGEAQGGRGSVRLHLQKGHMKLRKTGAYWWRPHLRGHGGEIPAGRDDLVTDVRARD